MKEIKLSYRHKLLLLLVAVALFTVYIPGLNGGFIFDDYPHIVDNSALQISSLSASELWHASLSSNAGPLKRPVAMFTLALNYYFSDLNPLGYKVTNILIHLIAAFFTFLLALLLAHQLSRSQESNKAVLIALGTMAIWGLHPYNLSSVLYVIQRMTSLAGLFTFMAIVIFVYCRPRIAEHIKYVWIMLLGILLAGLLAIFSKESALLLPVHLAIIEFTIFRKAAGTPNPWLIGRKLFLTSGIVVSTAWLIHILVTNDWTQSYLVRNFSLQERVLTQPRILWTYIWQILLPDITKMGLFLDDYPISTSLFQPVSTLLAIIAHIGVLTMALFRIKKWPVFSFAVLWFYGSHLLESTIFPLELMFEHRNYIASFGPIFAIVYYLLHIEPQGKLKQAPKLFVMGLTIAFTFSTAVRASYFGDKLMYTEYEAMHHPSSARANFYAGRTMTQLMMYDPKNADIYFSKAKHYYETAARVDITSEPLIAAIQTYIISKEPVPSHLWDDLLNRLATSPPGNNGYYIFKGVLEIARVGYPDKLSREQITSLYDSALKNTRLTGDNRGHGLISYALLHCNILDACNRGIDLANTAVATAPNYTEFKVILASLYYMTGQKELGLKWATQARKQDKLGYHASTLDALEKGALVYWGPTPRNSALQSIHTNQPRQSEYP
jgi:hypothetical protein